MFSALTLILPSGLHEAEQPLRCSCSPSSKNHQHKRCPSTCQHNSPVQKNRDTSLVRFFCAVVFCQMTLQQHKKRTKTPKDIYECKCAAFSDSEDPSIYDR